VGTQELGARGKVRVKLSLCLIKYRLTSALDGRQLLASRSGPFTLGERAPGTHWRSLQSRSGRGGKEKKKSQSLPGIKPRSS